MSADPADDRLLDGALVALGYRPEGYRLMRASPRARLRARVRELGASDPDYLTLLRASSAERAEARRRLAPASERLWRDPGLWARLRAEVLPSLGAARPEARIWVGEAGSGADAYTLAMLWLDNPATRRRALRIVASDSRPAALERARAACYPRAAARGLPAELAARWLEATDLGLRVRPEARALVALAEHDIARDPWPFEVDLLVLRNAVFQTWGDALREEAVSRAAASLVSHGWLVLGGHDRLPAGAEDRFVPVAPELPLLFRRRH